MIHSFALIPPKPFCSAMAAPDKPAISAWLSLVGIPKAQDKVAHMIIAVIAAQSAVIELLVFLSKFTIFFIVKATFAFNRVMVITPRKLKKADINIALLIFIHLVATQVAIEFGASVHPFTNITPKVSKNVMAKEGV